MIVAAPQWPGGLEGLTSKADSSAWDRLPRVTNAEGLSQYDPDC